MFYQRLNYILPTFGNINTKQRLRKGMLMAEQDMDFKTQVIAETDNLHYQIWKADEPDGETTFHLELNNVTIHFFTEEWEEFLQLIRLLGKK
jgi:hypothetical protein